MKTVSYENLYIRDPKTGEITPFMAIRGESAYDIAVKLGTFTGTEEEWNNYIKTERNAALAAIDAKLRAALEIIPDDLEELHAQIDSLGRIQISSAEPSDPSVDLWVDADDDEEIFVVTADDIAQELGDAEDKVLSQKAAKEGFDKISEEIANKIERAVIVAGIDYIDYSTSTGKVTIPIGTTFIGKNYRYELTETVEIDIAPLDDSSIQLLLLNKTNNVLTFITAYHLSIYPLSDYLIVCGLRGNHPLANHCTFDIGTPYKINGNVFDIVPDKQEIGYVFSVGEPYVTFESNRATLNIDTPINVMTVNGLINSRWTGSLTCSYPKFIYYDADTDMLLLGDAGTENHRYIFLGALDNASIDKCYLAGITLKEKRSKTVAFLGDSITAGTGTHTLYHEYIAQKYGWVCKNYGYGGSGYRHSWTSVGSGLVATGQEGKGVNLTEETKITPNDFLSRLTSVPTNIDALVIFGGTNDWNEGNYTIDEFRESVNNVLDYAQTNMPNVPIFVLTPIHRTNEIVNGEYVKNTGGAYLSDYVETLKEVCSKRGICVIDTYSNSGLYPNNTGNNNYFFIRDDWDGHTDGLHPNAKAHQRIANLIGASLYDVLYEYD